DILLKPHGARTHLRLGGVDAGAVSKPRVDVIDDTNGIRAAVGKLGDALDERDRLAEQPFFVTPRPHRRAKHQRSGEQINPEIHVSAPSPRRSPDSKLIGRIALMQY